LLRKKFFVDALELFFNPLDLLSYGGMLLVIQLCPLCAGQPPVSAVHNRGDHLQIADQFGAGAGRRFLLTLCFEKQRGIIQNALADRSRSPAPGRIQLPGLAAIAVMLGKDTCHPLTIFQALAGYRHQKLHRHLRRNLALAHLPLDRFWQQLN